MFYVLESAPEVRAQARLRHRKARNLRRQWARCRLGFGEKPVLQVPSRAFAHVGSGPRHPRRRLRLRASKAELSTPTSEAIHDGTQVPISWP